MRVILTGGSGFIGAALTGALLARGHEPWILSRSAQKMRLPAGAHAVQWDAATPRGWENVLENTDAVINLAGETIGRWPWTATRKQRILSSRQHAGEAILAAIRQAAKRPKVVIQASGIGYYGFSGDQIVTEESPSGDDFLARVCQKWEGATNPVQGLGVRWAATRSGLVLDPRQGVFPLVLLPFRLFGGGPLGSGRQWFPWIHLEDEVQGMIYLLENEEARGVFNFVAPELLTNAQVGRVIAKVMRRPDWLRVPGFAMRLALGEMSTLVLEGQRALPARLLDSGYPFRFATLEAALRDMLR